MKAGPHPAATPTRRGFLGMTAALAATGLLSACSRESGPEEPEKKAAARTTRTVTTPLGSYDIPADPRRVVAVDSRVDLEPALALGLPVIGYNHSKARPWVPVDPGVPFLSDKPNLEQILSLGPDLIVCCHAGGEWWPDDKLRSIAPVLTTDFMIHWRENLTRLATWLGRTDRLAKLTADYDARMAEIKNRHGDLIRTSKVAAISYLPDEGQVYVSSTWSTDKGLLPTAATLQELGGASPEAKLFSSAENGLSMEQLDRVADCRGFMINGSPADFDALMSHPLWRRLPAVKRGAVTLLEGDVYYGSIYTAPKVADGWDALYTKMAAA